MRRKNNFPTSNKPATGSARSHTQPSCDSKWVHELNGTPSTGPCSGHSQAGPFRCRILGAESPKARHGSALRLRRRVKSLSSSHNIPAKLKWELASRVRISAYLLRLSCVMGVRSWNGDTFFSSVCFRNDPFHITHFHPNETDLVDIATGIGRWGQDGDPAAPEIRHRHACWGSAKRSARQLAPWVCDCCKWDEDQGIVHEKKLAKMSMFSSGHVLTSGFAGLWVHGGRNSKFFILWLMLFENNVGCLASYELSPAKFCSPLSLSFSFFLSLFLSFSLSLWLEWSLKPYTKAKGF